MSRLRRILRSVRFRYITNYCVPKSSNCILWSMVLFIAAIVFIFHKRELEEDYMPSDLDEFEAANYLKVKQQSTSKLRSTRGEINAKLKTTPIIKTLRTEVDKRIIKAKKVADVSKSENAPEINENMGRPRFPLIVDDYPKPEPVKPIIKAKYHSVKIKPTEKQLTTKKLTYRDVFYAMAHPRLFPTTRDYQYKERAQDAHVRAGLNDWIQANNPKDPNKLLVYSAYWDDRFDGINYVRIIAVMVTKNAPAFYCRLQMEDSSFNDVAVSKKIMNEHWKLKYSSYTLSCEASKNILAPAKVFISNNRNFTFSAMLPVYQNRKNTVSPRGDMAVCVKPMHYYYDRATWLVEFIELHRILGVEHFFFYNHTVGENVDILLRKYMKENVVTILPWNLPVRSQKDIRTEGIFSSLNDCVYRTMYLFHYVILLDFDEYIIPREHENYLDLLEKVEDDNKRIRGRPGSFVFRNTFFYLYWENDTTAYGAPPEKAPEYMPYFITQYKTRRLTTSMKIGSRSKYIIVPERVVEVGNHVVWRHTSGSRAIEVKPEYALLHHYRICEFGGFSCLKKSSLIDRTANKFSEELLRRALSECQKSYPGLDGKCPISPPLGSPW